MKVGLILKNAGTVIALLFFISCNVATPDIEVQTGHLILSFDDNSRSILPDVDMNIAEYQIVGKSKAGNHSFEVESGQDSVFVEDLAFGEWEIVVHGKNSLDQQIAVGRATVQIHSGKVAELSMVVHPFSGTGTLLLELEWDPSLVEKPNIDAELINSTSQVIPLDFQINATFGSATIETLSLPSGYYQLNLELQEGDKSISGAVETVRIVQGYLTSGTICLDAINQVFGQLQLAIESEMQAPIEISIVGAEKKTLSSTVELHTTIDSDLSLSETQWYVNGNFESTGAFLLVDNSWALGKYRIDALTSDVEKQCYGSATFNLEVIAHEPLVVEFPDSVLETAIRDIIDKPEGDIYRSDLLEITELIINRYEYGIINNLEGIEYCENLSILKLHSHSVSDVSALASLVNLKELDLLNNPIEKLSVLARLTNLKVLIIGNWYDEVPHAGEFQHLSNLELDELWISSQELSDLSFISGIDTLTNLSVNLHYESIENIFEIDCLRSLVNLQELNLIETRVSDFSPLAGLSNLSSLTVQNNLSKDLEINLETLKNRNIYTLELIGCSISDLSYLANFTNLNSLNLRYNNIENISPIQELEEIRFLYLDNNSVDDITCLQNLEHLEVLFIENNDMDCRIGTSNYNVIRDFQDKEMLFRWQGGNIIN